MPSTKLTHGPGTLDISSRATPNPGERKQDLSSVTISDPVRTNMSDIPGSIEGRPRRARRPRDERELGICLRRQIRPQPDQQ